MPDISSGDGLRCAGDPSVYGRGKGNSGLSGLCVSGLNLGLGAFAIPSKADEILLVPSPGIAKPEFGHNLRKTI